MAVWQTINKPTTLPTSQASKKMKKNYFSNRLNHTKGGL
jgi:hypothetical protein